MKMLHIVRGSNIDFLKYAKPAFIASWTLIVVGIGYGFYRGRDVLGVEFAGGNTITMNFTEQIEVDQLRASATKAGVGDVLIAYQTDCRQQQREPECHHAGCRIRERLPRRRRDRSRRESGGPVQGGFPGSRVPGGGYRSRRTHGGAEIRTKAIYAALLALFGILVYVAFRYEFSFAVGAVVAIIHDILMTIGWYFLAGRELNATTVAALLTIIGFSINDTIVIFDRIREDLRLGMRGTFREVINKALNQTLSRTIITSGTVFLATVALYIFGGRVINDFAFTFLVGIITGTYSSIYIASALVFWWHKGQRPAIGAARWRWKTRLPCPRASQEPGMLALVEITGWHWVGFIVCVLFFLALDLGVFHRRGPRGQVPGGPGLDCRLVLARDAFALLLRPLRGEREALEFVTGYLIELSLSMDNVFVIALIFSYFRVPAAVPAPGAVLGDSGGADHARRDDRGRRGPDLRASVGCFMFLAPSWSTPASRWCSSIPKCSRKRTRFSSWPGDSSRCRRNWTGQKF